MGALTGAFIILTKAVKPLSLLCKQTLTTSELFSVVEWDYHIPARICGLQQELWTRHCRNLSENYGVIGLVSGF